MKKLYVCVLALLLCGLCLTAASANSWGLSGHLLERVSATKDWNDYTSIATCKSDKVEAAVLSSRYHNVLLLSWKDQWGEWMDYPICTTCVYQPEDKRGIPELQIKQVGEDETRLVITYHEPYERYEYCLEPIGDEPYLCEMEKGNLMLRSDVARWEWWSERDGVMRDTTWWAGACISPQNMSLEVAPDTEEAFEAIFTACECAGWTLFCEDRAWGKGKKIPVYAAPSSTAFRAAKGKASVTLDEGVTVYGTMDGYDLVEYAVSQRTSRFGWIAHGKLGEKYPDLAVDGMLQNVPVVTKATYLTDDPHVGQYHLLELPEGTEVTLMLAVTPFYGYVRYTEDVWGFVPLKDLVIEGQQQTAEQNASP